MQLKSYNYPVTFTGDSLPHGIIFLKAIYSSPDHLLQMLFIQRNNYEKHLQVDVPSWFHAWRSENVSLFNPHILCEVDHMALLLQVRDPRFREVK